MALLLIEDLVNKLAVYMKDNLANKLTQLEAEYADGVELPSLTTDVVLDEGLLLSVHLYPTMYVFGNQTVIDRYGSNYTDAVHDVMVGILFMEPGGDASLMRKRMYRYMRAVWELILDRNVQTEYQDFYTVGQPIIDFNPLLARDESGAFLSDARINMRFNKQETYDG